MRPVYASAGAVSMRSIQITETTGKDIHSDPVLIALLPYGQKPTASTAGKTPDHTAYDPAVPSVVTVGILIDDSTAPGTYRTWARIADTPEIEWLEGGLVEVR